MTMARDLNPLDRIRIERVVWSLDQRLYDLPRRVRITHRRDLRHNLNEAARDIGVSAALRDLGGASALADAYLEAHHGSAPRARWTEAAVVVMTATFMLTSVFFDAAKAFGDGILAGDPDAEGTFRWSGISSLQNDVTYTVTDGEHTFVGGSFSPLTWVLLALGFVVVGRVWRVVPNLGARRHRDVAFTE